MLFGMNFHRWSDTREQRIKHMSKYNLGMKEGVSASIRGKKEYSA